MDYEQTFREFNSLKDRLIEITKLIEDCRELPRLQEYITSQPFYPEDLIKIKDDLKSIKLDIEINCRGIMDMNPTEINTIRDTIANLLPKLTDLTTYLSLDPDYFSNKELLNRNADIINLLSTKF